MTIKKFIAFPIVLAMLVFAAAPASAQTGFPTVQIQLATTGLTNPLVEDSENATLARLMLNTTGSSEAVRLNSLPFILTTGNGALASTLDECQVFNEANNSVSLNGDGTSLSAGLNNVVLDSPLILQANTQTVLSLRCDIDDTLVAGGTYTFSMNTANVVATGATTGVPAIVTVPGSPVIPPVVVPPVTPGFPSTGANGDAAQNAMMIAGAGLVAMLGLAYSRKQQYNG